LKGQKLNKAAAQEEIRLGDERLHESAAISPGWAPSLPSGNTSLADFLLFLHFYL
jgi:hypothetical protein